MAIHQNRAGVYIVETHEQLDNRGFARAGRPYNGDLLAFLYLCGEIIDNDFVRVVAKMNVIKGDIPLDICR